MTDSDYERLAPVRWPVRTVPAMHELLADRRFFTATNKAQFVPTAPSGPASAPDDDFPFVMLTGRIRDHWHTMTRTGKSPRLSQTRAEPFVEIDSNDALAAGLPNRSLARIKSANGEMLARIEWSDNLRRGEVFVPMHWTGEFSDAGRVGPLIAAAVDAQSGQPELKSTPVTIERLVPAWYGFILSRHRVDIGPSVYSARSRGQGYWRYEMAGVDGPRDWSEWARQCFGAAGEWIDFADRKSGHYRGARLVEGRLDACLLAGRPADGAVSMGPIICACYAVGRNALVRAIADQEVATVKEIGQLLNAGTNCGSCIPELNGLLAAHRPARDSAEAPAAVAG